MILQLHKYATISLCACITMLFVTSAGMAAWSSTEMPIMPHVPKGIHITYSKTTHALALPKEEVNKMVRAAQTMKDPEVARQFVNGAKSRASKRSFFDTAEYWGTMHRFAYKESAKNYAAVYDGTKCISGTASAIFPAGRKYPGSSNHGELRIMKDTGHIDSSIPLLGFFQPGKSIFNKITTLVKVNLIPSGEERIYGIPIRNMVCVLRYDKKGRITTLTSHPGYDTPLISERYTFSDYASVGSTIYPRMVVCEKMRWILDSHNKLANIPDTKVIYHAIKATADLLPESYYSLASIPANTRIIDARYRNPESDAPMITYKYNNVYAGVDETSRIVHQKLLTNREVFQQEKIQFLTMMLYACMIAFLLLSVYTFIVCKKQHAQSTISCNH